MEKEYIINDLGNERILIVGNKEYKTYYSRRIIELLIKRKGLKRATQYFTHKEKRAKILNPLFNYLNSKTKNLKVLEVGCSSGHITEYLNEQRCIEEIYNYDIDKAFVEITNIKKEELNLHKVKRIDHLSIQDTLSLPYENNFFDLIVVLAIVEHLPFENRHVYVDNYYKKLKVGGIIGFWDTPNRFFPLERHSIGLPFIHWLSPQIAFIYAKLFRKLKDASFTDFIRAGTGWRNSSYYELLPKSLMIDIKDISEEVGYFCEIRFVKLLSRLFDVPVAFFTPSLNVVFRKEKNYE